MNHISGRMSSDEMSRTFEEGGPLGLHQVVVDGKERQFETI